MYRRLILFALMFAWFGARAQFIDQNQRRSKQDSLNMKQDSANSKPFVPRPGKLKIYHPDSTHSPRKAVLRSAYFPGLGQIYNRHGLWWRLPLLYGGLGALAYNIYTNGKDYNSFLRESEWRSKGRPAGSQPAYTDANGNLIPSGEPLPYYNGTPLANISDQTIYDYKDNLRRNRDLSIFSFIGVWGINVIDAYVEAKFMHSYTMDSDLSFKITPSLMGNPGSSFAYASNLNYTFTPTIKINITF